MLYWWTLNYSKHVDLYTSTRCINSFSSSFPTSRVSLKKSGFLKPPVNLFQLNPVANANWFGRQPCLTVQYQVLPLSLASYNCNSTSFCVSLEGRRRRSLRLMINTLRLMYNTNWYHQIWWRSHKKGPNNCFFFHEDPTTKNSIAVWNKWLTS